MSGPPIPNPWGGGDAPGGISRRKGRGGWRLRIAENGRRVPWTFYDDEHGGSEGAHAAAVKFRYERAVQNGTLTNRYRPVVDPLTNDKWYDVELTMGKIAQIDPEHLSTMTNWKHPWHTHKSGNLFYMRAELSKINGKKKSIFFHTLITNFEFVDHLDGNGLNCRRRNLVKSGYGPNARNRARNHNSTTGVSCVNFDEHHGKRYVATWHENKRQRKEYFYITERCGRRRAFVLAVLFRRCKEIEFGIVVRPPQPRPITDDMVAKGAIIEDTLEMEEEKEDEFIAAISSFLASLRNLKQPHTTTTRPVEETPERKEEHEADELPLAIREILKRPAPTITIDDAAAEPPTKKRRIDDFFKPQS